MDRRDFLRSGMAVGSVALSGCLEDISGKISTGAGWPPGQPITPPDEAPELPPPTWGDPEAPTAFVYNDMATRQAGRTFNNTWDEISKLARNGYVQISLCDYPLPWNEWSYPVAIAARSVQYHAGRDSFLTFSQEVLRDYVPDPYFTKQRILDAAEVAGAPRDAVEEDTESWRFYPVVKSSRETGTERGVESSVTVGIVVLDGKQSSPITPSAQRIKRTIDEMSQENPDDT